MARRGQPGKYETNVKPRLKEIEEWARDYTNKDIAKMCGVHQATFSEYIRTCPELSEALKRGRAKLVSELRSALIKKACGYTYTEKKIIKALDEETREMVVIREEIYEKYAQQDVAAINLLLKNYDPKNWANDPQALELRRQEIQLTKKKIENSEW